MGILITALRQAGIACLPCALSRMGFLNELLGRPAHERPMIVVVAGYPADGVCVPAITRKPFDMVTTFV